MLSTPEEIWVYAPSGGSKISPQHMIFPSASNAQLCSPPADICLNCPVGASVCPIVFFPQHRNLAIFIQNTTMIGSCGHLTEFPFWCRTCLKIGIVPFTSQSTLCIQYTIKILSCRKSWLYHRHRPYLDQNHLE